MINLMINLTDVETLKNYKKELKLLSVFFASDQNLMRYFFR